MWDNVCMNCKYFFHQKNQCRRLPPYIPVNNSLSNRFPIVLPEEDWCGEFEKKKSFFKKDR